MGKNITIYCGGYVPALLQYIMFFDEDMQGYQDADKLLRLIKICINMKYLPNMHSCTFPYAVLNRQAP